MSKTRLELHESLCEILGSKNVYFSPPSRMSYPCIKYDKAASPTKYADNRKYHSMNRWTLTIIDEDPDSNIPDKIAELRYCSFDRSYVSDGLYHFIFTLYF